MQDKMMQVRAKVAECIKLAEETFNITMPDVPVSFNLRGKSAGIASCRKTWGGETSDFSLRFNREHMALGGQTWLHLINDTVPHEVAHSVCQAFPQFGKNHNNGWKRVCAALGGNSQRCYSDSDAPEAVAKQSPYMYTTTNGYQVRVSKIVHNKIQYKQASYRYKRNKGSINKEQPFTYAPTPTAEELAKVAPVQQAANTVAPAATKPLTVTEKVHTPKPRKKVSNAEQIRTQIRAGKSFEECVEFGVHALGMKRGLAKTYVKNNWNK